MMKFGSIVIKHRHMVRTIKYLRNKIEFHFVLAPVSHVLVCSGFCRHFASPATEKRSERQTVDKLGTGQGLCRQRKISIPNTPLTASLSSITQSDLVGRQG